LKFKFKASKKAINSITIGLKKATRRQGKKKKEKRKKKKALTSMF